MKQIGAQLLRFWKKDLWGVLLGGLLFGAAYNIFLLPGNVIVGGFTGIATLLYLLWGWNSGLVIFLLNLPILLLCTKVFGISFGIRTLLGILLSSLAIDYLTFFPVSFSDPLLCAALGGAVLGIGCGLFLVRGYTTGGSDLIAQLIQRKRPAFSTGRLLLGIDAAIVLVSALILRQFETAFYAMIAIFCFSRAVDLVLVGAEEGRLAIIFSDQHEALTQALLSRLGRGVTCVPSVGAFRKSHGQMLLCVVRPGEVYPVKSTVREIDPTAFFLFARVDSVIGKGFDSTLGGEQQTLPLSAMGQPSVMQAPKQGKVKKQEKEQLGNQMSDALRCGKSECGKQLPQGNGAEGGKNGSSPGGKQR